MALNVKTLIAQSSSSNHFNIHALFRAVTLPEYTGEFVATAEDLPTVILQKIAARPEKLESGLSPYTILKSKIKKNGKDLIISLSQHRKVVVRLKGGDKAIQRELQKRAIEIAAKFGIVNDNSSEFQKLLSRIDDSTRIEIVSVGTVIHPSRCSGTYFGSGHYTESFVTNAPVVSTGSEDTGFARPNHYRVSFTEAGQWLHWTKSSYPGSNFDKIIVCR